MLLVDIISAIFKSQNATSQFWRMFLHKLICDNDDDDLLCPKTEPGDDNEVSPIH